MTTQLQTIEELQNARAILDGAREHLVNGGLLLFTMDVGTGLTDYIRATTIYQDKWQVLGHLTAAIAVVFDYPLRYRAGNWHLAISGYGFSKTHELANRLADYYGVDTLNTATL